MMSHVFHTVAHATREFIIKFIWRVRVIRTSSDLLAIIKRTIRQHGPLTVERYMEMALQHPQFGYYRQGNPIGPHLQGDFGTAPEMSQLFGEMIGVWCLKAWEKMGKPASFTLLELGPGLGTLLRDVLRFTETVSGFQQALKICLLESSQTLRSIQQQRLAGFSPVHIDNLDQLVHEPLLVIANEFFDNIPLRQFIRTDSGWAERVVSLRNNRLVFATGEALDSSQQKAIGDDFKQAILGGIYEISSQSQQIIAQISMRIVQYGGEALIIDYGYTSPTGRSTLDAWSRFETQPNVLSFPGKIDVTADVNFSALCRAAEEQGAHATNAINQRDFLFEMGIAFRARALISRVSQEERERIEEALDRLLSPNKMGCHWKVMTIGQG